MTKISDFNAFIMQKIIFSVYLVTNQKQTAATIGLLLNIRLYHCYNEATFNKTLFNFVSIRDKAASVLPFIPYVIHNTYGHC